MSLPWRIECGDGPAGLLACDELVDHVFVDVPYGQHVDDGNAAETTRDNAFGFEPMTPELRQRIAQAIGAKTRRWALIMTSEEETHEWRQSLRDAGMNVFRTGQWVRLRTKPQMNGMGPAQGAEPIIIAHSRIGEQRWNGGGKPAVWYAPIVQGDDKVHPTQKPEQLLQQLIEDFSDPGETWADLCGGSFVSGIVSVALGRRFVGWDIDPKHVALARERFKLPLFDRSPIQAALFEPRASSRAATMRAEIDREIMRMLSDEGVTKAEIATRIEASKDELTRALQRLRKGSLIERQGNTRDARYFRTKPSYQATGETP